MHTVGIQRAFGIPTLIFKLDDWYCVYQLKYNNKRIIYRREIGVFLGMQNTSTTRNSTEQKSLHFLGRLQHSLRVHHIICDCMYLLYTPTVPTKTYASGVYKKSWFTRLPCIDLYRENTITAVLLLDHEVVKPSHLFECPCFDLSFLTLIISLQSTRCHASNQPIMNRSSVYRGFVLRSGSSYDNISINACRDL